MVPDRDASLRTAASIAGLTLEVPAATVAVVRSDNRRGAVAEALALLGSQVRPVLAGPVAILAHLGRSRAGSTCPSALSSLLDVVLEARPCEVVVASGHRLARDRFDALGFRRECWGRPVRFLDLARDEGGWELVDRGPGGPLRISGTIVAAGCRIALTPLAALGRWRGDLSCRLAIREAIRPADRPRFDGEPIPRAWPDLSVVEGPIGRSAVAIAGLDPLAVDAVAAGILGLGARRAGRLESLAHRGAGVCDPGRIAVLGDAVGPIRPAGSPPVTAPARGVRRDAGHADRGGLP